MTVTVYVPRDSAALSVGADHTAEAIVRQAGEKKLSIRLVRNGSRGMFWLEPLVEVETASGRIAYGPVTTADVGGLFAADFLRGGAHALRVGPAAEIPYMKRQTRLTFARVGVTDPVPPFARNFALDSVTSRRDRRAPAAAFDSLPGRQQPPWCWRQDRRLPAGIRPWVV